MPEHCPVCGAEIKDGGLICKVCGAHHQLLFAQQKIKMLDDAIEGWRASNEDLKDELAALRAEIAQFRAAIWSDDSTATERGGEKPEDAARFVSGLRAGVARWKHAVEGTTPGGSEFVNDPERCAEYIRESRQFPKQIVELRTRLTAAYTELRKLRPSLIAILDRNVHDQAKEAENRTCDKCHAPDDERLCSGVPSGECEE